jgi:hypothetical protein
MPEHSTGVKPGTDAAPTEHESVIDDLLAAVTCIEAYGRADAATLADLAVDHVIAALQRDPRMPPLSTLDFELLLTP